MKRIDCGKIIATALVFLLAALAPALAAGVPNGFNGFGSVTRASGSKTYSASQLIANNTTGTAVPISIVVNNTIAGSNLIVDARVASSGTSASGAAWKIWLYSQPPTLTNLIDGSTYAGPYAADYTSLIGYLTCSAPAATNDATPQYWSQCSVSNLNTSVLRFNGKSTTTTLYGVDEVTTGYTAISGEVESIQLATVPGQ